MSDLNQALLDLQDKVAALLTADPYFEGITVHTERKGDIRQSIASALSKLGLGVAVITPGLTIKKRLNRRIIFQVTLVIECAEIVVTNQSASGSKKPALAAATAAMLAIDSKGNGRSERLVDTLDHFELDADTPLRLVPDKTLLVYHVIVTTDLIFTIPTT